MKQDASNASLLDHEPGHDAPDMRPDRLMSWPAIPTSEERRVFTTLVPRTERRPRPPTTLTDDELATLLDGTQKDHLLTLPANVKATSVTSREFSMANHIRPVTEKLKMLPIPVKKPALPRNPWISAPWVPFASDFTVEQAHEDHLAAYNAENMSGQRRADEQVAEDGNEDEPVREMRNKVSVERNCLASRTEDELGHQYDWKSSQMAQRPHGIGTFKTWRDAVVKKPEMRQRLASINVEKKRRLAGARANVNSLLEEAYSNDHDRNEIERSPPASAAGLDLLIHRTPQKKAEARKDLRRKAQVNSWEKGVYWHEHDLDWHPMAPIMVSPLMPIGIFNADEVAFHADPTNEQARAKLRRDFKLLEDAPPVESVSAPSRRSATTVPTPANSSALSAPTAMQGAQTPAAPSIAPQKSTRGRVLKNKRT